MHRQEALETIDRLAGGYLIERLAEALVEIGHEVAAVRQPGAVTLKLVIKSVGDGTPEIYVEETITPTRPKRRPRGAILWAVEGGLYQDDPRQEQMFPSVVAGSEPTTRRVDGGQPITREA